MPAFKNYRIASVEADLDRKLILDWMLGREFLLHHDLGLSSTSIIIGDGDAPVPGTHKMGLVLEAQDAMPDMSGDFVCAPVAVFQQTKLQEPTPSYYLDNLYRIFHRSRIRLFSAYLAPSEAEISALTLSIEDRMSRIEVRSSHSDGRAQEHASSRSAESYYQSFEKELLSRALGNLTDIQLARQSAYKAIFIVEAAQGHEQVIEFLKSNAILLGAVRVSASSACCLLRKVRAIDALPLSYSNASFALPISGNIRRMAWMGGTTNSNSVGDIAMGSSVDDGLDGPCSATLHSRVLNLGTIITGLPGTGKTKAAMLLIEQSLRPGLPVAIISPTGEWNGFAAKNSMGIIKLGKPGLKINFFRCESGNRRRFYENLSMLIASGCKSGPYENSMEKCILAALSKVYLRTSSPDPQEVYEEIEESIIEQHGKRGKTSVKYTKHGENIRSGLESLRQLLMNPQFAYADGIDFRDAVGKGAIFDLSELSNNAKPLVYALLLNQVYTLCDEFDLQGNDALRFVICLEEAQLVFDKEGEESATVDLQERIQNFRKSGVALIVICHNVTDISPGIRRLCQNKLYFRQSADVAKFAANDLVFAESDYDKVIGTLKTLGQRVCAFSTVSIENGERVVSESTFTRTLAYREAIPRGDGASSAKEAMTKTVIAFAGAQHCADRPYEIYYLGEKVAYGNLSATETSEYGLLDKKTYRLVILMEKKKDNRSFSITGGAVNVIECA